METENTPNTTLAIVSTPKLSNEYPWERLPGEDSLTHEFFLCYLHIGPTRTLQDSYRKLLLKHNRLVPGQPAPELPERYKRMSSDWSFASRALAWDEKNWGEESVMLEKVRKNGVQTMVERQIEGWEVLQQASILSFFARDEETGEILYDVDGNPMVEMIEDKGIALRAWKQAVAGERTARGLPAEIMALSTEEIQRRIVEIRTKINAAELTDDDDDDDDEVIDGEFTIN